MESNFHQADYTGIDSSIIGAVRTLSRIDRAFINMLMAEARDPPLFFHVFENLGKRSIPSDHAAIGEHGATVSQVGCLKIQSSVLL